MIARAMRGDMVARARRDFTAAYGREPDGVWSAPGRVNLMGEHTDYNQGLCLPIALPQRTFAAVGVRDDGLVRARSAQNGPPWQGTLADVGPGRPEGWAGYVAGVVWALAAGIGDSISAGGRADLRADLPGLDIWVDGHVPAGAGLSSSAALECATALAVDELWGLSLGGSDEGRALLAQACRRAENEVVGAPTGGLDQSASLRCTAGHALLLDFATDATEAATQVPLDLDADGLGWLVIDTRASHALTDGQYGARRRTCEAAAAALGFASLREIDPTTWDDASARLPDEVLRRRARHVVTEIVRVRETVDLLAARRATALGPVLDASHASMRDDFEISCPELDIAVESARAAGALGARMTGGGFGGSAVALVPAERSDQIARDVEAAFAAAGLRPPGVFAVTASAGAARVA